ncbi:MAG TPA: 3-hydroxyacyl-CoA dehydrogenase NAD-binding domain-containing protein, partial [Flavobacteriales bacterium]|nr:3-hydroxyacyl-CoA dehydrogenase NAD-binding domain-containing protein [Flavobacteriales bacterium]
MKKIAVIGAGTMGNGIAHTFAQFGFPVILVDVSDAALSKGIQAITQNLDRQVQKGILTEAQKTETLTRISTQTQIDERLTDRDLVVEAASENFQIKSSVFKQLDQYCQPSCI